MVPRARCAALLACLVVGCSTTPRDESSPGDGGGDGWSDDGISDGTGDIVGDDDGWSDDGISDGTAPDGVSDGSADDGDGTIEVPEDGLTYQWANLTNFESYPEWGSSECHDFSGCEYFGRFAGYDGVMSYEEVMSRNIAAVHSNHFDQYVGHILRLYDEDSTVDVEVLDLCSDHDCNGCCTTNMSETGFLIDLEIHTAERLGTLHGKVRWACVDC